MSKNKRTLTLELVAQTNKFSAQLKSARGILNRFGSMVRGIMPSLMKWGSIMSGAIATGFGIMINKTAVAIDELGKFSKAISSSTEDVQVLSRAAELSGASSEMMRKSLMEMSKRVAEASRGAGTAKKTLDALGLSAESLTQMGTAQAFEVIAQSIGSMENPMQQALAAYELFGRSGTKLIPLMKQSGQVIASTRAEMQRTGELISLEDAFKVEEMNDAMTRLRGVFNAFMMQLTVQLAPAIEFVVATFQRMVESGCGMKQIVDNLINGILTGVGRVLDVFHGWQQVWNDLGFVATSVMNFIGGLLDGNTESLFKNKSGVDNIGAAWNNIKGSVLRVFAEIVNAFNQVWFIGEAVFTQLLAFIARGFTNLISIVRGSINSIIGAINTIPGVELDLVNDKSDFFENFAKNLEEQASVAMDRISGSEPLNITTDFVADLRDQSFAAFDEAAKYIDGELTKPSEKLMAVWNDIQASALEGFSSDNAAFEIPEIMEEAKSAADEMLSFENGITDQIEEQNKMRDSGAFISKKASTVASVGGVFGGVASPSSSVSGITPAAGVVASADTSRANANQEVSLLQGILEAVRQTAINTRSSGNNVAVLG